MVGGSVIWLVLFVARASDVEVEVTVDGVDPAPSDSISLGDAAAREPASAAPPPPPGGLAGWLEARVPDLDRLAREAASLLLARAQEGEPVEVALVCVGALWLGALLAALRGRRLPPHGFVS